MAKDISLKLNLTLNVINLKSVLNYFNNLTPLCCKESTQSTQPSRIVSQDSELRLKCPDILRSFQKVTYRIHRCDDKKKTKHETADFSKLRNKSKVW